MMAFLGNLVWFVIALTIIIIFLSVAIIGLACLDYTLDSDIKGALVKWLGPRPVLRKIHLNCLKMFKQLDKSNFKEDPDGIWKGDEDYDAEIHELLEKIEKEAKK